MISKEVKWVRPAPGWDKLNTDGSFSASNGRAGCGGIIRGSDGQCITGFAMSINASSSFAAKLWALREGLSLCMEMHLQAVEVELDASAAISLVLSNSSANGDLMGLVDNCREMLLRMPQAKVSHCYREANFCVDALARIGASSPPVCNCFVTPLPQLLLFCFMILWGCVVTGLALVILVFFLRSVLILSSISPKKKKTCKFAPGIFLLRLLNKTDIAGYNLNSVATFTQKSHILLYKSLLKETNTT